MRMHSKSTLAVFASLATICSAQGEQRLISSFGDNCRFSTDPRNCVGLYVTLQGTPRYNVPVGQPQAVKNGVRFNAYDESKSFGMSNARSDCESVTTDIDRQVKATALESWSIGSDVDVTTAYNGGVQIGGKSFVTATGGISEAITMANAYSVGANATVTDTTDFHIPDVVIPPCEEQVYVPYVKMQKWTLWADRWAWQQDATIPCHSYGTLWLTVSCDFISVRGDGTVVDSEAFVQDRGLSSLPVDECDCSGGGGGGGGGGDDDDGNGGGGGGGDDGNGGGDDDDGNGGGDDGNGGGGGDDGNGGSDGEPSFFELVLNLIRLIIDMLQFQ